MCLLSSQLSSACLQPPIRDISRVDEEITKIWGFGIGNIVYISVRILEIPLPKRDSHWHQVMACCTVTLCPLMRLDIAFLV